ncbi:MAG: alpha/beta fold hydrolase [Candidatus Nanopelagicales bacterium]
MRKRIFASFLVLLVLVIGVLTPSFASDPTSEDIQIEGGPFSATDDTPVNVDARIYIPETTPAPAIILAHGFGGSKEGLSERASQLQEAGYVVLTYSARGFGKTLAPISMNSPQYEIQDAIALVDFLATRSEVQKDSADDPRVGVAGGSYGGALALLLAGYDSRVDALSSDITWNNLETALFSQYANNDVVGVFKKMWTGYFFSVGMATPPNQVSPCGRFSLEWCLAYQEAMNSSSLSELAKLLMRNSSPTSITSKITIPSLIMVGQADSLFDFQQAFTTAKEIQSAHPETPLKLIWHAGGHDGGRNESDKLNEITLNWFDTYLKETSTATLGMEVSRVQGAIVGGSSNITIDVLASEELPDFAEFEKVSLKGETQSIVAPVGGEPANISVVPGLGSATALLGQTYPNQGAFFQTETLGVKQNLIGASKVTIEIASDRPLESAVLFASLRIIRDGGRSVFPNGLVSSVRIENVSTAPQQVDITLPAIVAELNAGDKLQLVITTTDIAYTLPTETAIYQISVVRNELLIPKTSFTLITTQTPAGVWLFGSLLIMILIAIFVFLKKPRKSQDLFRDDLMEVPVRIENLTKEFKGGVKAVNNVTWEVPSGFVIGLLGPNGAGKTTTMRMVMGLIQPTAGEVYVFGNRIHSGSSALSNIGALVEGAGFLPHLSGRENLELFWKASGRTGDPGIEDVLKIADLGTAVERKVRTYSQGMRQRLGIAQAMLGMPKLLILDEPTNGLDPPQIREMREVMSNYAKSGRTVIVSSHMLSEVEQTCSHVIVMHRGQLVTMGRVDELLQGRSNMRLEDFFLDVVGEDLTIGKQ